MLLATAASADVPVLSIGRSDNGYAEFALAQEGHSAFSARFPGEIIVDGDSPDAAAAFPYIQPSTSDAWAGSREHEIRVDFTLREAPSGFYRLTVDLVATHWGGPPVLVVGLNDAVRVSPPQVGSQSDAVLRDDSRGTEVLEQFWFPAEALGQGENRLSLRTTGGSWVLYDAIRLDRVAEAPEAADTAVFRIGTHDNSYRDLALGSEGYGGFSSRFPDAVRFSVGRDDPAQSFPYIHPGPGDAWAGSKPHPIEIDFALPAAPAGDVCLLVDLVAAHGQSPPLLRVDANGSVSERRLAAGPGDDVLGDPAKGREQLVAVTLPADCLRPGQNRMTLTMLDGSWALYDALELFVLPTRREPRLDVVSLRSQGTVLRDTGEGAGVLAALTVDYWGGPKEARLSVEIGGQTVQRSLGQLPVGRSEHRVPLPAPAAAERATVHLQAGDLRAETVATLQPPRPVTVYVAPSIHTDIGYTHIQPECAQRHADSLKNVIRACEDTAGYPEGSSLRWNCEVTWEAEQLLSLHPEEAPRLSALCREGPDGPLGGVRQSAHRSHGRRAGLPIGLPGPEACTGAGH